MPSPGEALWPTSMSRLQDDSQRMMFVQASNIDGTMNIIITNSSNSSSRTISINHKYSEWDGRKCSALRRDTENGICPTDASRKEARR